MQAQIPKISVIVPVYNSARTLEICLASLARLADANHEVLVVDDGSTDGSVALAQSLCESAGFTFLSLPCNKGQAVARNHGARRATGTLLAFVDADVTVPETWLTKYRELLAAHADVQVICSGYVVSTGDAPPALFASHEAFFRRLTLPSLHLRTTTSANCIMDRRVFEEVGGYPEYYLDPRADPATQKAAAINEDSELGFLIAEQGHKILWSHENYVRHHFRDSWRAYLRQQFGGARAGVVSVFQFPKILITKDLYAGEPILPQLAVIAAMLAAPLLLPLGLPGLAAAGAIELSGLLFFATFHARFFRYLGDGMGNYGRLRVFLWMLLARVVWLCGVVLGLRDGCRMRILRHFAPQAVALAERR